MPAHIQSDDAVLDGEFLQLIFPLARLSPKPMNENKRPLGMVRRNINRRKPYQRICRNAHFVAVEVKVNVHAGSLHDVGSDVNFNWED